MSAVSDTSAPTEPELFVGDVSEAVQDAIGDSLGEDVLVQAFLKARGEVETLKQALKTRTIIGQATGIVMNSKSLSAEAAFDHLVSLSSHSNVKIRDLASALVAEADQTASQQPGVITPPS